MDDKDLIYEERFQRFSNIVSTKTMRGFMVVDRNDKALIAVLVKPGQKMNHLLHLLLSLVTCGIWIIVWIILAVTNVGDQRVRISIDNAGNSMEEIIKT
jgi:hypothetical protein